MPPSPKTYSNVFPIQAGKGMTAEALLTALLDGNIFGGMPECALTAKMFRRQDTIVTTTMAVAYPTVYEIPGENASQNSISPANSPDEEDDMCTQVTIHNKAELHSCASEESSKFARIAIKMLNAIGVYKVDTDETWDITFYNGHILSWTCTCTNTDWTTSLGHVTSQYSASLKPCCVMVDGVQYRKSCNCNRVDIAQTITIRQVSKLIPRLFFSMAIPGLWAHSTKIWERAQSLLTDPAHLGKSATVRDRMSRQTANVLDISTAALQTK